MGQKSPLNRYVSKIIKIAVLLNAILVCKLDVCAQIFRSPSTPEVAAFNRNIETPVSLYSGVADISIPLYEINIKGVSIPIVLSYHSGGIRADQEATWVGLGWSLDYGGQVSRKVNGAPDEEFFFNGASVSSLSNIDHFNQLPLTYNNFSEDLRLRMDYIRQAKNGAQDFMPDEFYFNTLGYSGKFMFSQKQNKFILFPKDDIEVKQFYSKNQYGTTFPFYGWNLYLPDGVVATFGKEATVSNASNDKTVKNSWEIKTIRNIFKDSISFQYESQTYSSPRTFGGVSASFYHTFAGDPGLVSDVRPTPNFYLTSYNDCRIKTIVFPTGSVDFVVSDRIDMPTKALSEIRVKNTEGVIIRRVIFKYSYFYGSNFDIYSYPSNPASQFDPPADYRFNRLKLDAIEIKGTDNNSKKYSFEYNTSGGLPSKYTYAQDHWGFYNGASNTTAASFIPNIAVGLFQGGDRSVRSPYNRAFSLKSITYPEGGKIVFDYETNTAQIGSLPYELLSMYQDENIKDISQVIHVSSYSRRSYSQTPDSTSNDAVYFLKKFTVSGDALMATNPGFSVSTDYGISEIEKTTPFSADNAEFYLYKIGSDGRRTLIKTFNTTPQNSTNNIYIRTGTCSSALSLLPGNYEMGVRLIYLNGIGSIPEDQRYDISYSINYRQPDPTKMMINVGGLRIKNIRYYDINGTLVRKKTYNYVNPTQALPSMTSGRLMSLPSYFRRVYQLVPTERSAGALVGLNFFSNSVLPLETTCGSYAGYEKVDELDVDSLGGRNLKTSYQFSFNPPYFFNGDVRPYMELRAYQPQDWENGKLLSKTYFKGSDILKKEEYSYYSYSPNLTSANNEDYVQEINTNLISMQYLGTAVGNALPADFYDNGPSISTIYDTNDFGQNRSCIGFSYGAGDGTFSAATQYQHEYFQTLCPNMNIKVPYFLKYSGFNKLKSKVTTSYDGLGNPVVYTENYFYEKTPNLYQLTRQQSATSNGETFEKRILYPIDSLDKDVYSHMRMRHIINTPIASLNYENSAFVGSNDVNYKIWADTTIIAPVREMNRVSAFPPFAKAVYLAYDNYGNPLSIAKSGATTYSAIWGYNGCYLKAEITNANQKDVFLEDFEEGSGNSVLNDCKTGRRSFSGTYLKTLNNLSNGSFELSYWEKSNGTWIRRLTDVKVSDNSYKISLAGQIDDVHFSPKSSAMTTYTYDPLIGVTSKTDAGGHTSYYEYDGLQRLNRIKDQNGSILQSYDYHYKP